MYTCISDPLSSDGSSGNSTSGRGGSKAGSIGGAVGGALAAMAVAGILFFLWRKRHQRAKRAVKRVQQDAKVRAAGEKFQLGSGGAGKKLGGAAAVTSSDLAYDDRETRSSRGNEATERNIAGLGKEDDNSGRVRADGAQDDADETDDINDEDTEWTELRSDGLTAFRRAPGINADPSSDLDPLALDKRRSTGAATHLSRITEGQEDEDEDARSRFRRSLFSIAIHPMQSTNPTAIQAGKQVYSSGSSVNLVEPYGSAHAGARSRRTKSGQIINDPFSDQASVQTNDTNDPTSSSNGVQHKGFDPPRPAQSNRVVSQSDSKEKPPSSTSSSGVHSSWNSLPLEHPQRVLRAAGAPLIDLQGKPKRQSPSPRAATSPLLAPLASHHEQQHPSLSTPKQPLDQVQEDAHSAPLDWSPAPLLPHRPMRSPELNLRLPDGAEPGKIGEDLKSPVKSAPSTSQEPRFASTIWNGSEDAQWPTSPAAPSTTLSHQLDADYPAKINRDEMYSQRTSRAPGLTVPGESERRHSANTMHSVSTMDSVGLDYVLSAPKIVRQDGLKRVQLNQGKAQLVRNLSSARKERDIVTPESREQAHRSSERRSDQLAASDPFQDNAAAAAVDENGVIEENGDRDRLALSPTTTFGGKRTASEACEEEGRVSLSTSGYDTPFTELHLGERSRAQSQLSELSFGRQEPNHSQQAQRHGDALRDSIPVDVEVESQSRPNSSNAGLYSIPNATRRSSMQHAWTSAPLSMPRSMSRQSNASSIAGLSILEGIPFRVAGSPTTMAQAQAQSSEAGPFTFSKDPLPDNAHDKIKEAREAAETRSISHSVVYMEDDATGETQNQGQGQGPFADKHAVAMDDWTTVPEALIVERPQGSSISTTRSAKFDELRLQHELDAYPFQR